jgi:endonuclease/exonuclease/phosphatase family metal-dependent hydrolase
VLLQEMNAPGTAHIAEALGLHWVYYPASRGTQDTSDFGNAVLSRWPIEVDGKLLLPHLGRGIHRARTATWAQVALPGGPIRVYSLHLGSPIGTSPGNRADQADTVVEDALKVEGPILVGGDFNSKSAAGRLAKRGFLWPTENAGGSRGSYSYDHVLARGFRAARAGVARGIQGVSDHRPVWAVIER